MATKGIGGEHTKNARHARVCASQAACHRACQEERVNPRIVPIPPPFFKNRGQGRGGANTLKWRSGAILALAFLGGCVVEPEGVAFSPPAVYAVWADELFRCAGFEGDGGAVVASIRWRVSLDLGRGDDWIRAGRYGERDHSITLEDGYVNVARVVKHELIHHMVPGHDPEHESPAFKYCTR